MVLREVRGRSIVHVAANEHRVCACARPLMRAVSFVSVGSAQGLTGDRIHKSMMGCEDGGGCVCDVLLHEPSDAMQ